LIHASRTADKISDDEFQSRFGMALPAALLRGGVVDWLAPSAHGGSMNLADLSLNAAVLVIIAGALLSLRPTRKRRRRANPDAAA